MEEATCWVCKNAKVVRSIQVLWSYSIRVGILDPNLRQINFKKGT